MQGIDVIHEVLFPQGNVTIKGVGEIGTRIVNPFFATLPKDREKYLEWLLALMHKSDLRVWSKQTAARKLLKSVLNLTDDGMSKLFELLSEATNHLPDAVKKLIEDQD